MIKKLRRKIILTTFISVFSLLAVILGAINTINFVGCAKDADMTMQRIVDGGGELKEGPGGGSGGGEQDPEAPESMRYFTISFTSGVATTISYKLNRYSESECTSWAKSLLEKRDRGWTKTYYRYRIYKVESSTYVSVLDQTRELTPSYRILIASSVAAVAGSLIVLGLMFFISKKMVKPIEDNYNKQKRFIADAAMTLKTPVSVISIDNASLTKKYGEENSENKSIRKQVDKLLDLSNNLNNLVAVELSAPEINKVNLSNLLKDVTNQYKYAFSDNHKEFNLNVADDIELDADSGMVRKVLTELLDNALKYSDSKVDVNLIKEGERTVLEMRNDCQGIPEGSLDQVFNKFYRLDFKDHSNYDGSGLGLSIAKEIIEAHKGRIIARGENNEFIIKIEF